MERFREDINRYRFETDTTWTALAEKAGVSPAMFTRLKKGSIVTLEAFAQLCASCRLNPIDYMPELQTAQEHETAKERPMEENEETQHRRQGIHHKGRGHTVRLGLGERSTYQRRGTARRASPRQHHAMARRMALASRRRGLATDETGRRTHGRIHRPGTEPSIGHRQPTASHRGPVFRHKHRPMGVHDGLRLHHSGHRGTNHAGTSRRPLVSNPLG